MPRYILVHDTASTNSYLSRMASLLPSGTVIHTPNQTQGRGQRGNTWESEPGKNITFSYLIKQPEIAPAKQFFISEAVSLAIVTVLSRFAEGFSIKWPNDIYHGDRKISGILIEHSLTSNAISHTIIGVGLNVNQMRFSSDAPNPVSLAQIIGKETETETLLRLICEEIEKACAFHGKSETGFMDLHHAYLQKLYRNDGNCYKFVTPEGAILEARISTVSPDGTLILTDHDGNTRHYAFKEIGFVL